MQNEAVFSDLMKVILTRRDITILMSEISLLKESVYKTDTAVFGSTLRDKVRKKVADIIGPAIEKETDREKFLNHLESLFKKVPTVEIVIATDLTQGTNDRIVDTIRQSVPGSVVDFKIDRSVMAGATISNSGKYFDGSIAKKLREFLGSSSKTSIQTTN